MAAPSMIALLMLAGADPTITTTEAAPEAKELKQIERQICRQETVLGSRVAQKVTCGTKAEWAVRNRESKHFIDKAREGGRNVYGGSSK